MKNRKSTQYRIATRKNSHQKKTPSFYIDVATHFGKGKQVSYKTVAQWVIAEYKSQGDMQENPLYKGDKETYRLFDINNDAAIQKTTAFFEQLKNSGYSAQQK